MKQEVEMLQEEMDDIIKINKDQMPVMLIGGVSFGMDLAEKINRYWDGLGDKYGFKPSTVEGSSRGKLFFLAEPKPIVKPKTQEEIEIDKYLGDVDYKLSVPNRVALSKIVKQFESCNYLDEEIHSLADNVAFLALKKLAE